MAFSSAAAGSGTRHSQSGSVLCAADGRREPQLRGVGSLRQPPGPPGGEVPRPVPQQRSAHLPVRPAHHHPVGHEDQDPQGSGRCRARAGCAEPVLPAGCVVKPAVSPQVLTDTSLQKVKRMQNCLEPCVRQLVSCLESDMVRRTCTRNVWIGNSSCVFDWPVVSCSCLVSSVSVAASALPDSGGRLRLRSLHGHSGSAGLSSGHQHVRLLSGNNSALCQRLFSFLNDASEATGHSSSVFSS